MNIHRSLRSFDQKGDDAYLHTTERNAEGIIVSGTEAHITGAINSREIIVFPTRPLIPDNKASHVRDWVTEMIHLCKTLYCFSIACSAEGWPTPSGAYMVIAAGRIWGSSRVTGHIFDFFALIKDPRM